MAESTTPGQSRQVVFWHRHLPPLDAEVVEEHTLEAASDRVPGHLERGDELWGRCHASLMARTEARLQQELQRLGGDYAHVFDEWIDGRHDDAAGESWLHGRFKYTLYRRASPAP